MPITLVRRWAYRVAAALAVVYAVYVIALKLAARVTGGPLGDIGEFLLVLACVTAFAVGLFADEAVRVRPPA
ncbi:hypothetical protein [Ideonella sp. A 288]|uniref:hypothetical protein n=1 Tax=Ideonella sp. A 288 TaxID=1962181 RepID=UPI000B4B7DA8|nr:hypothetical protein [Ideonella sp. A 288]